MLQMIFIRYLIIGHQITENIFNKVESVGIWRLDFVDMKYLSIFVYNKNIVIFTSVDKFCCSMIKQSFV